MVDTDTFLTTLYVLVDDFCLEHGPVEAARPGPKPSLSCSEVSTLAIFGQWSRFRNQRDFYRFAQQRLRAAFPTLPNRTQFNRLVRAYRDTIVAFFLYLVERLDAQCVLYEVLDTTGVPVRNVKRRGRGWLAGQADIGWCTRLGWFNGFRLLLASNPAGVITGFGFGAGNAKDQPVADTFVALRQHPHPQVPSVGQPARGPYVLDTGFEGQKLHQRWRLEYGVQVICLPKRTSRQQYPKPFRRWVHSIRQMVETVYGKLMDFFRLDKERPHDLTGFQANLAAKVALHNFCIWLNQQLGRPALAFADLLDW
ncbi:MAG: IS982 family transposase [Chloroflexi bacterium]|nr:IS982 family transposase [Chloroflexota bacterium]MBU1748894.1 IS982 family transposase [Chloroflexota bacterium]